MSDPRRVPRVAFSREDRVMGALLLLVPATLLAATLRAPAWLQFFLSVAP